MTEKGRKTDIYYWIKAVQEEVHAFEDVYFNFDWKNVMTVLGEENETVTAKALPISTRTSPSIRMKGSQNILASRIRSSDVSRMKTVTTDLWSLTMQIPRTIRQIESA